MFAGGDREAATDLRHFSRDTDEGKSKLKFCWLRELHLGTVKALDNAFFSALLICVEEVSKKPREGNETASECEQ